MDLSGPGYGLAVSCCQHCSKWCGISGCPSKLSVFQ